MENPSLVTGRRVLVIEDGPTLTHGGMQYGAGVAAAKRHRSRSLATSGAAERELNGPASTQWVPT